MKFKIWILFLLLLVAVALYQNGRPLKSSNLTSKLHENKATATDSTLRNPASPQVLPPSPIVKGSEAREIPILQAEVTRLLEREGKQSPLQDPFADEKELSRQTLSSAGGYEYRTRLMKLDGIPYNVFIFDKIEKGSNQILSHAGIVAQVLKIKAEEGTTADQIQSMIKSLGYELGDFDFLPNYYLIVLQDSSLESLEKAYKALSQSSLVKSVNFDHLSIL